MTVVLAIRCSDAMIMASDSQATEAQQNVRRTVDKVFPIGPRAVWGGSGVGTIISEVGVELDAKADAVERAKDPATIFRSRMRGVVKSHYDAFLDNVPGQGGMSPATALLAAGYGSDDDPFIVEINPSCLISRYEDMGFHAIGSGAAFAQMSNGLLAHFELAERNSDYGLLAAVRVLDGVINTSAFGVGQPIQLWKVTPEEGANSIDDGELQEIRTNVGLWQSLEAESLDRFLLGDVVEEDQEPLPDVSHSEED